MYKKLLCDHMRVVKIDIARRAWCVCSLKAK